MVSKLFVGVLEPITVFLADAEGSAFVFDGPFANILIFISKFSGDGWDVEGCENPVIHISTNLLSDKLLRIPIILIAIRELSLLLDLLKDCENSWVSSLDIIFRSSVIWVDPHISIRMEIVNKLDLMLMISHEFSYGSCFRLRERFWTSVALAASVGTFVDKILIWLLGEICFSANLTIFIEVEVVDKSNLSKDSNTPISSIISIQIDT